MRMNPLFFVAAVALMSACGEAATEAPAVADERDAAFLVDGKADRPWLTRHDIRHVFVAVNRYTSDDLTGEVGLDVRAADGIVDYRRGDDGEDFTADDRFISSLRELDDRPWVGPHAFEQLIEHTRNSEEPPVSGLIADNHYCDDASGGLLRNGECASVSHVIDGDTMELRLADDSVVRVRLRGIDTPECHKARIDGAAHCIPSPEGERFGYEAYQALSSLVGDSRVRVACEMVDGDCRTDLYGRYLAWILLERSYVDVAEVLVAGGYAWPYFPMEAASTLTYCAAEDEAMTAGRGMWAEGVDVALANMSADKRRWYGRRELACSP